MVAFAFAVAFGQAQAILAEAKDEAEAGPAEASMVATVIAEKIGADAAGVARNIALALTCLGIAVTQNDGPLGRPGGKPDRWRFSEPLKDDQSPR